MYGTRSDAKALDKSGHMVDAALRFGKNENLSGLFVLFVDFLQQILQFRLLVGLVAHLHHLLDVVIRTEFHRAHVDLCERTEEVFGELTNFLGPKNELAAR